MTLVDVAADVVPSSSRSGSPDPEDGGTTILQDAWNYLHKETVSRYQNTTSDGKQQNTRGQTNNVDVGLLCRDVAVLVLLRHCPMQLSVCTFVTYRVHK